MKKLRKITAFLSVYLMFLTIFPQEAMAMKFTGEATNNETPSFSNLWDWASEAGKTPSGTWIGYRKITEWAKKNLQDDVDSWELLHALNRFTIKNVKDPGLVGKEVYKKLAEWTKKQINADFPVGKHIKTTWQWADKNTKKLWKGAEYLKGTTDFVKMFFRKDTPSQAGNLIHRAAKDFKEFTKSDFMTTDFKDFNYIKRVLKNMKDDATVKVSKIIKTDIERIQQASDRSRSDLERAAQITVRSMWLVTKTGAYLIIALPTKLAFRSAAAITALSYKVLSRSVAVIAYSLYVAGATVANFVTPAVALVWPVIDIALIRVGEPEFFILSPLLARWASD